MHGIQQMMKREIHTRLTDEQPVCLRPIRRDDRGRLAAGIDALSDHSRYLRFFSGARTLPDPVVDRLVDVDGVHHIAWGGMVDEGGELRAIGAAHAMRQDEAPEAELAFGIIDAYHSKGLARLLIAAVIHDCRRLGIHTLTAETLAENRGAARLLRHIGGFCYEAESGVYSFKLDVADSARRLRAMTRPTGLADVYAALDRESPRRAA